MNAPHGPSEQELVAQTLKTAPGMSWSIPGGNHGGKSIEQTLVRLWAAAHSLLDFFWVHCGTLYFEFRLSAMTPMFIDSFIRRVVVPGCTWLVH
jgi:hypothetical protein